MKNQIKIVICGSPHSGKSVLQPGRGFITYASSDVQNLGVLENEIQGINLKEFLEEVKQAIDLGKGGEIR